MTEQLRDAILDIWASDFWISAAEVRERLLADGHIASLDDISEKSIHQVAQDSGFAVARRRLRELFRFTAAGPQWRDGVLIGRLFELNETLMARLEAGEGLTPQLRLEAASLKQALGAPVTPLKKPLPWAYQLQQALFGQWQDLEEGGVPCPHCGSTLVARKENTPRRKKYRDPQTNEWREAEGYRYYCRNPVCKTTLMSPCLAPSPTIPIDIYPYNGKDEARAFLQALKAKGYRPQVIITDMNQDYSEPIRQVFPEAEHHECVFHALQWAQRLIKEVYGNDYAGRHPEAEELKERIYKIFDAKTRRTVDKRYREVMDLQDQYVAQMAEAVSLFEFLERHYPKLVNAVENPLIPLTNNTVELVIRRFDQHYQNMCALAGLETARAFLNLFELVYRFTPFVEDNRPVKGRALDIRGKCPLELAGYDISHMPIAKVLRARILGLPPETLQQTVPSP